jgi:hypothetical protein
MLSEDFPQLGRAASYDVHGTARQVAGFKDLIKIGRVVEISFLISNDTAFLSTQPLRRFEF